MSLLRTPDDSTAVVRIMGEFDRFLKRGANTTLSSHFSLSDSVDGNQSRQLGSPSELQSSYETSLQSVSKDKSYERKKEVELCTAKSKIARLENELCSLKSDRKRQRIENDKEDSLERQKIRRIEERYDDLQENFKLAVEREKTTREELKYVKKDYDNYKSKAEQKIQNIQREKLKFSSEVDEVKENAHIQLSDLRNTITRLEADKIIFQNKYEDVQTQLDMVKKRNMEMSKELQDVDEYRSRAFTAEHKVRELEEKVSRCLEANKVSLVMQNQLSNYHELEKQNSKLLNENRYFREMRENNLLLKEQLASVQEKLKRAEVRLVDLAKLETQNQELSKRIKKWEVSDGTSLGSTRSPVQMANEITRLQQSQALLLEKQGNLKSSVLIHENAYQKTSDELGVIIKENTKLKTDYDHLVEQEKRLRRRLILVTTERDGFRRILNTYDTEDTINYGTLLMNRAQEAEDKSKKYADHIEALEEELSKSQEGNYEYKIQINKIQSELDELKARDHKASQVTQEETTTPEMKAKLEELQKENGELKKKIEYFELKEEKLHMQGDYDPRTTKVVHFAMNPLSVAQNEKANEMEKLREECEMLRRKIISLEEKQSGESSDEVQIVGITSSQEVKDLKNQLASAETKLKRLKEIFSKKIQEFREACYALTGYKIDFTRENQYRLQSMYAEQPDDSLLFERNSKGEMMLLSTDFSSTISEQIDMYLKQYHSIPAFLSTITIELFSHQTAV